MKTSRWLLAMFLAHGCAATASERFENRYLSFTLPDGWICKPEGTEFVCPSPEHTGTAHPALMILTAKMAGPTDTLAAYKTHLEQLPLTQEGCTMVSRPALVNIQGMLWVDATLLGSEVKSYDTRYVATVTHGLAVLFTFSVHKDYMARYAGALTLATQTLKVKPDALKGLQ